MANNSISTTPIIRISQLPRETARTMSANPANTWFAIVNADVMKTRRLSLEELLKWLAQYFAPSDAIRFFEVETLGGLSANGTSNAVVYLGNTFTLSDQITFDHAKSAFNEANVAHDVANLAFTRANLAFNKANVAYDHAASAYDKANSDIYLFSEHGVSLTSNNSDPTILGLGDELHVTADPIGITVSGGLKLDSSLSKSVYLGESFNIDAENITINTTGGITGGKSFDLGQTITLDANGIYNHVNSAYNYANGCMINPAINYITENNKIAYANNRYYIKGNDITLTLQPGTPKVNTYIYVTNMTNCERNILAYNGTRIHGLPHGEDVMLDVQNVSIILCYTDPLQGWTLV